MHTCACTQGIFHKSVVNNVNVVMIFDSSGMQLLAWLWS